MCLKFIPGIEGSDFINANYIEVATHSLTTHTHSHILLKHSHTHLLTHTHTHILTRSLAHTHTHSHTHTSSLPHSLTPSPTLSGLPEEDSLCGCSGSSTKHCPRLLENGVGRGLLLHRHAHQHQRERPSEPLSLVAGSCECHVTGVCR